MLSPAQLAFMAGVIDCRGHIRVETKHGRPEPRIRITTRREAILTHMANATGSKVRADDTGYDRRPCGQHCREHHQHAVRQSHYWNCDGSVATVVLWNVQQFIVCQVDEVRTALRAGLDLWPPDRSLGPNKMARLGWPLPPVLPR